MVFDEVISPWRDTAWQAVHKTTQDYTTQHGSVITPITPEARDQILGRKTGELASECKT